MKAGGVAPISKWRPRSLREWTTDTADTGRRQSERKE